ncbi:carbohydrate porin [Lichenicoccus sp.]|uniref:carbohydrate porin n=1 Tax=Lichenicoccus sp. TaxID=2781899 RepID=UPI003D0AD25D
MRSNIWIASASAMLAAYLVPMGARAGDPTSVSLATSAVTDNTTSTAIIAQAGLPHSASGPSPGNGGSASGLSTNPSNNTTGGQSLTGVPLPLSGPPLTGLFPSLGRTLLDDGIEIHGISFDHFLANPTAGNITGQTYNFAVVAPAVDLDLGKLVGVRGGNVHLQLTFFGLRSNIPAIITDTGGFLTGTQTTPGPSTDPVLLSVLTYEQKLLGDRLSIEAGRTNVYHYFLIPNSIDVFTYFASTFNVVGNFNSNPYPTWGGRATYHFTPTWYVQGGAFEDDFYRSIYNPNDLGGVDPAGAQILGEVGHRSEFSNAAYPSNLELGAEWNTRSGFNPHVNVKGAAVLASKRNEATDYPGGGVFFFQGQQVLWRGARKAYGPPTNIALYGSVDASFDKPQPIDMDALAGINFTGFVPGRPFDVLELQAHYQRLSAIEANYETRTQNRFAGPGPAQSRNGYAFEVVGNIQLTPWLGLRPNVQYFVDPDNLFDPAQRRRPSDGFEAGALAIVSLGKLLGTSNKPF